MFNKLPLAWLQLTKEKTRLLTAIAGVAFADILMFIQIGFEQGLYASANGPHYSIDGELVLVDAKYKTIFYIQNFSRRYLYQILAVKGVKSVSPLYISSANWINPLNRNSRSILVLGMNPGKPSLNFPEVRNNLDELKRLDNIFFDRASRPEYGPVVESFQKGEVFTAEVEDVRVKVRGLFTLGASFSAEGNFLTSDLTFGRIFNRNLENIEVGVIQLEANVDKSKIQQDLAKILPDHLMVLTIEEFAIIERDYWAKSTGIGFMFGLGAAMGFVVGAAIVYQILYSDVADHLPEYATLKAMGYSHSYLLTVLIQQSLILSLFGYIPGLAISWWAYNLTSSATMLPIYMSVNRALLVFILTLVMSAISASIAVFKLAEADPADVF